MAKIKRWQFHWIDMEAKTDRPFVARLLCLKHIRIFLPRRAKLNIKVRGKVLHKVTIWYAPRLHFVKT